MDNSVSIYLTDWAKTIPVVEKLLYYGEKVEILLPYQKSKGRITIFPDFEGFNSLDTYVGDPKSYKIPLPIQNPTGIPMNLFWGDEDLAIKTKDALVCTMGNATAAWTTRILKKRVHMLYGNMIPDEELDSHPDYGDYIVRNDYIGFVNEVEVDEGFIRLLRSLVRARTQETILELS